MFAHVSLVNDCRSQSTNNVPQIVSLLVSSLYRMLHKRQRDSYFFQTNWMTRLIFQLEMIFLFFRLGTNFYVCRSIGVFRFKTILKKTPYRCCWCYYEQHLRKKINEIRKCLGIVFWQMSSAVCLPCLVVAVRQNSHKPIGILKNGTF